MRMLLLRWWPLLLAGMAVEAFPCHPMRRRRPSIISYATNEDGFQWQPNQEQSNERPFNPFEQTPTSIASLREFRLKRLNEVLLAAETRSERYEILASHRDLLLETDHTADTYATIMEDRIQTSRHPTVRLILQEMKDYVWRELMKAEEQTEES